MVLVSRIQGPIDELSSHPNLFTRLCRCTRCANTSECDNELVTVQRALRRALCTAPVPLGQGHGAAATSVGGGGGGMESAPGPLSAGLGPRKAPACLLAGYLVESGVPGWEDTKAAMIPPPHELLEAAEGPTLGASATHAVYGEDKRWGVGKPLGRRVALVKA